MNLSQFGTDFLCVKALILLVRSIVFEPRSGPEFQWQRHSDLRCLFGGR